MDEEIKVLEVEVALEGKGPSFSDLAAGIMEGRITMNQARRLSPKLVWGVYPEPPNNELILMEQSGKWRLKKIND